MCRVFDCTKCAVNESHYCKTCDVINVAHNSDMCPIGIPIGGTILCRVVGCTNCVPGEVHYCRVCNVHNVHIVQVSVPKLGMLAGLFCAEQLVVMNVKFVKLLVKNIIVKITICLR